MCGVSEGSVASYSSLYDSDSNYSFFIHCASFGELCNTLETLAMWNEYRVLL